jgi:DNA repair protein RadC
MAAFEVARRVATRKPDDRRDFDADIVGRELIARCGKMTQERLGAIFLDARQRIISDREIYVGTIASAIVSTRDVIRFALEANAVGVVLFHNHPSGDHTASTQDIAFTQKMHESLLLIDIELVDHLVIGSYGFSSLKRKGVI